MDAIKKRLLSQAFLILAEWTGLEPATPGVTGRYSNQLNYHSKLVAIRCRMTLGVWLRPYLASPRGFEPLYSP